jgi:rhodanese-related sulfurtransferase
MSWNTNTPPDLDPAEVNALHTRGEVVLVDVREETEIAAERIAGAHAMPLSRFDPAALPEGDVVLYCLGGKRSAMAMGKCREAGVTPKAHMRGGLTGWKAAGLPTTH